MPAYMVTHYEELQRIETEGAVYGAILSGIMCAALGVLGVAAIVVDDSLTFGVVILIMSAAFAVLTVYALLAARRMWRRYGALAESELTNSRY